MYPIIQVPLFFCFFYNTKSFVGLNIDRYDMGRDMKGKEN